MMPRSYSRPHQATASETASASETGAGVTATSQTNAAKTATIPTAVVRDSLATVVDAQSAAHISNIVNRESIPSR